MPTTLKRKEKARAAPKSAAGTEPAPRAKAAVGSNKAEAGVQPGSVPALNAQERERLIALAAYFRAEKRGFAPGRELQDWIEAEAEVLRLIGTP